jgi:hypothetical protein
MGFSRFSASTAASALNSFVRARRPWSFFPICFSFLFVVHAYCSVCQTGVGPGYPAPGQARFKWSIAANEANGKAVKEFGLLCAGGTLFARTAKPVKQGFGLPA